MHKTSVNNYLDPDSDGLNAISGKAKIQTSFPSVGNGLDFSMYAVVPAR